MATDHPALQDARGGARAQVNDIAALVRGLVDLVRNRAHEGAFTVEDVTKITTFLAGQVERAGEELVRIVANDPSAFTRFDFDMPIAAPQARRERHPIEALVTASQQSAPAPVAPPQPQQPPPAGQPVALGRLSRAAGGGVVRGNPPPPPKPETGAVGGVDFLEDGKENANG